MDKSLRYNAEGVMADMKYVPCHYSICTKFQNKLNKFAVIAEDSGLFGGVLMRSGLEAACWGAGNVPYFNLGVA